MGRPAELHLSTSTFLGNSSIFRLLNENAPISSPQMGDLQEMLSDANKLNQAKKTLLEQGSKDLARNERKHGSLDPDSKFLETYPRLGLVLILTHRTEKLSKIPTYAGPALILALFIFCMSLFQDLALYALAMKLFKNNGLCFPEPRTLRTNHQIVNILYVSILRPSTLRTSHETF